MTCWSGGISAARSTCFRVPRNNSASKAIIPPIRHVGGRDGRRFPGELKRANGRKSLITDEFPCHGLHAACAAS
jgi:hypothetical protein